MREWPVFIPFVAQGSRPGDPPAPPERLAAIITIPDGAPSGLVLLLTGASAIRSHRFGVWARTARRLAEAGVASARFDYLGTGDSTGSIERWTMADLPVDQALAVMRFAQRAAGVDRVGVAGNCLGARVALRVAAELPECVAALCLRTPVLQPTSLTKRLQMASRRKFGAWLRSTRLARLAILRPLGSRRRRTSAGIRGPLQRSLGHASVLFAYSREDYTYNPRVEQELARLTDGFPPDLRARYELRVMEGGDMVAMDSLASQQQIIDTVSEWMIEHLGRTGPAELGAALDERERTQT